jgi:phosphate transport system permease protein
MVFLLSRGWPVLGRKLFFGSTPALDALLGLRPVWDGIWPSVAGTLCLLLVTLILAVPPGVGCGLFLACYAAPGQKYWLGLAVDLLAGIPSIVMGLFGFVLIVWLRRAFLPQGTTCLLLSSFCLALLVLPSLVAGTRAALEAVPERLVLTAAALGFSYGQTVRRFLLPAAGQGILGGVMLAMGRAAEDTAVIMLTGVVVNAGLPSGLTAKFEALPFRIYYTAAQYADQRELQLGFGTALVLLCLSSGLLFCAWALQRRLERRWKGIRQ